MFSVSSVKICSATGFKLLNKTRQTRISPSAAILEKQHETNSGHFDVDCVDLSHKQSYK